MANDKEVIKKLLAIANKQQKIITKLAQAATPAPAAPATTPPPQDLNPNQPKHMMPVAALKAKVEANPSLKGLVTQINADNTKKMLIVHFAPGKMDAGWKPLTEAFNAAVQDQSLSADWKYAGTEG